MKTIDPVLPFPNLVVPELHLQWLSTANAGSYCGKQAWFYPFKSRFCRAHGVSDGFDLQIIKKKCWCGDGIYRGVEDMRPPEFWEPCNRCGGTGIYDTRRISLIRWRVGSMLFHEPCAFAQSSHKDTIRGIIKHEPEPDGKEARRCMERLLLRYEPRTYISYWQSQWRAWAYWKGVRCNFHISKVKRLLRTQQQEEIPF